jgi:hypothetical protein
MVEVVGKRAQMCFGRFRDMHASRIRSVQSLILEASSLDTLVLNVINFKFALALVRESDCK